MRELVNGHPIRFELDHSGIDGRKQQNGRTTAPSHHPEGDLGAWVVDGDDDELKTITRESPAHRRSGLNRPSEPAANVPVEWRSSETRDFDTRVGNRERLPVEGPKDAKRLDEEGVSVRLVCAVGAWP